MITCHVCDNLAYYCDDCYYEDFIYYYEERVEQPEEVALADIFIMEGSVWEPAFPLESNA